MFLVQRPKYLFLIPLDNQFLSVQKFLQGSVVISSIPETAAISILRGEVFALTEMELKLITKVPSDKWVSPESLFRDVDANLGLLRNLAEKGLMLLDSSDEPFVSYRKKNELLQKTGWDPYAAIYHFMTKWGHIDVKPDAMTEDNIAFQDFIKYFGNPPHHFHTIPNKLNTYKLPLVKPSEAIFDLLTKRKTTRAFDSNSTITRESLSIILYYVFGCHGYCRVSKEFVGLKKTSPSGGDLHPIEVYLIIVNVSEMDSGIYHYNVESHSLEMKEKLSRDDSIKTATTFMAGQTYFGNANILFVMTARFERNFWKYRRNGKTYSVILMDAAHLSQTFYLLCAHLGLGAFVTAAINGVDIEERLGLNGIEESAIAIVGCGNVDKDAKGVDPEFTEYIPGKTELI